MKRLIALILITFIMTLTLIGCSDAVYSRGQTHLSFEYAQDVNAKVEANKFLFNKNDVTLDLFYCFYCLDNHNLDQVKDGNECIIKNEYENLHFQSNYAIYLSNNKELIFEKDEQDNLVDQKNKVNATLYRYFTFEEAFATDYGFTSSGLKINYNHSEKITIPEEFFDSSNNYVYIHVVWFWYDVLNETTSDLREKTTIEINYELLEENRVLLNN